jgi:hypothetical protein
VLALGVSAFKNASNSVKSVKVKKDATNYWVYTSSDNSDFRDASKYTIISMSSPDDEGCDMIDEVPCVFKPATGSLSTSSGLNTYLQSLSNDAAVLSASLRTKSKN